MDEKAWIATQKWHWFPWVWAVVVHVNPEMAELGNPRGEIRRDRFFLCAESERGDRYVHWGNGEESELCAELRCALLNANGALPNPDIDHEDQPCYGSEAYANGGWDRIRLLEELKEDHTTTPSDWARATSL